MKRTADIKLSHLRKKVRRFAAAPLAVAVASVLAGCSDSNEQVVVVSSVDDCVNSTQLDQEQCEVAYRNALAEAENTAPRYRSQEGCEYEFGNCQRSDSGFWMPFMAGWIVSEIIDEVGDYHKRKYRHPVYRYRDRYSRRNDRIVMADGSVLGKPGYSSYSVKKRDLKPKPKVTKTIKRGGFGSKASAKSSWGSSRSSWGG